MNDWYGDKYRVHNLVKFDYSEIGKYVDENHTDKPLRNDELVDLLNEQDETQLKEDIRNIIWILKTVKIDFKLSINEFESLERLVEYSEFKRFDGDVE